jgi:hypothetical protein
MILRGRLADTFVQSQTKSHLPHRHSTNVLNWSYCLLLAASSVQSELVVASRSVDVSNQNMKEAWDEAQERYAPVFGVSAESGRQTAAAEHSLMQPGLR